MIVNVHTRTGAIFQFASGKDMRKALPGRDDEPVERVAKARVPCWVKWTPESEWKPVRLRMLRRSAIAFVVGAEDTAESEADLPAKAAAERRRRNWEESHGGGVVAAAPEPVVEEPVEEPAELAPVA